MDVVTQAHVESSKGYETLGPAYFAAREIAEKFMAGFEAEHFEPLAKRFSKELYEQINESIQAWLLADTENNLHGSMWRMVDDCVKALLSGERWAIEKYALGPRYEAEKIRAAVAAHIPQELQDARIADLEAEVKKLKEDNEWLRKLRS